MKKLTLLTFLLLGLLWVGLSGCESGLFMDVEKAMAGGGKGTGNERVNTFIQSSFPKYPDISADRPLFYEALLGDKTIFSRTISKTSEIKILDQSKSFTVDDESSWNDYLDDNYDKVTNYFHEHGPDFYKGVFRKGRTINLRPYVLGEFEVTRELYEAVLALEDDEEVNKRPSYFSGINDNTTAQGESENKRPVECISWYDAIYFCNALTKCTMPDSNCVYEISSIVRDEHSRSIVSAVVRANYSRYGYRLPTEDEWEYAARGGDMDSPVWKYAFSGADTYGTHKEFSYYYKRLIDERNQVYNGVDRWLMTDKNLDTLGWYFSYENKANHPGYSTHEAGKKLPNTLGLYDMNGNVREWCTDAYTHSVFDKKENDPSRPVNYERAVIRGGAWIDEAYDCTVSSRNYHELETRSYGTGLRIARTIP